jgi:hypothetical protein
MYRKCTSELTTFLGGKRHKETLKIMKRITGLYASEQYLIGIVRYKRKRELH